MRLEFTTPRNEEEYDITQYFAMMTKRNLSKFNKIGRTKISNIKLLQDKGNFQVLTLSDVDEVLFLILITCALHHVTAILNVMANRHFILLGLRVANRLPRLANLRAKI